MVVTNGITNFVGLVDLAVSLGDGTVNGLHQHPYNVAAAPYNYSDMTGFNMQVVNPGRQPLKGYWIAVQDSGNQGQLWNKVSWSNSFVSGCSVEAYVRASDTRNRLGSATWVQATNNIFFQSIRGRYIEVRVGMTRDAASKQPALYDLTLQGISSSFTGYDFLLGGYADEGTDADFWTELMGAEPVGYRWFRKWPWETNLTEVIGETNYYLTITNVDSWVDGYVDEYDAFHGTMAACLVTNGNGESLWLGPEYLTVDWVHADIPDPANYPTLQGPASRYPAAINVFGVPTNFSRVSVTVTLYGLNHARSADMSVLLVSPLQKQVMLMSNVGGTDGVSHANLLFQQYAQQPSESAAIPSNVRSTFGPSNYGGVTQMPRVGMDPPPTHSGTYPVDLNDFQHDDPNGVWKLYIYDNVSPGGVGELYLSWSLDFTF